MSHLRDRRAFGNIGTRRFRGARFGDALSPRGPQYTKEGRVLDYSTDVGPFTIVDQSGEGNTATLYSGRGLTIDAGSNTVVYDTNYTSASRTAAVWMRVSGLGARTLNGATGTFTFTPTATNIWEQLSSTATVTGDLTWAAGSNCDIGDLTCATEHWTHNDWSNPAGNTSNGKIIVDSGPNKYHGTATGCSGFTGEGIDPEVAGIVGYDDKMWFDGVNDKVTTDSVFTFPGNFSISANVYLFNYTKTGYASPQLVGGGVGDNRIAFSSASSTLFRASGTSTTIAAGVPLMTAVKVTVSRAGTTVRLSLDDVLIGTATNTGTLSVDIIGQLRGGGGFLNGLIWDVNINNESAYSGSELTTWTDTIGSNDGTVNGAPVTLGQKRATIPQTADKNWNKYQCFNGTNTKVDCGTLDVTAYTSIEVNTSFATSLPVGNLEFLLSLSHSGSDDIRLLINTGGYLIATVDSGVAYTINFGLGYNDGKKHTVNFILNGSGLSGTVDGINPQSNGSATFNFSTAAGSLCFGQRFNGTASYGTGTLFGINISNQSGVQHAWSGLGNDPWKDTVGNKDGTESGSFTRQLVTASDANDQIDALGTATSEPRLNTQQLNLFGEGELVTTLAAASLDTIKTVSGWIWHDSTARTVFDLGTPTVGTTTAALTSSGFTGVTYFVNGASGTTLLAGWNHCLVASTAALDCNNIDILSKSGSQIDYDATQTVAEALVNYNTQKSLYGL